MQPVELLSLAPMYYCRGQPCIDWRALFNKTKGKLEQEWGTKALPEDTTLGGLTRQTHPRPVTRQIRDPGTRVARVLWVCYLRGERGKSISKESAQRNKDAGLE